MKARREGQQHEVRKGGEAIRLVMDQCDDLQMLMAAEQWVPIYLIEKNINNESKINSLKTKVRTKPKDDELEIHKRGEVL